MLDQLPALQVVVPLLGAVLAALVRRPTPAWVVTMVVSFAMPLISALLFIQVLDQGPISYQLGGWDPEFGIEYRVDVFSGLMLLLVSSIAAVIAPFSYRSVSSEIPEGRCGWFYSMYLIALAGLLGIVITGDAFNAFVFLEISSLSSYAIIAMGRDRRALVGAYQYLIMGTIGASFYVIGVGLIYTMTGTLNIQLIAERLPMMESTRPVLAALAFIIVGISLKLALFPLHVWLPNAYAYAPSFATVFLAATATKVAIYLFARFVFSVFGPTFVFSELPVGPILIVLSVAAIFGAGLTAIFQSNLKRMFAYSSVGQVGYITLGLAMASVNGLTGGIVHLLNHATVKAGIFMGLGAIVFKVGNIKLDDIAGIGKRMPIAMSAVGIACLSLIGVPGTAGFISKWYLVLAALDRDWWWLAALIVVSSILTTIYVGRFIEAAWFREPEGAVATATEPPIEMLLPIVFLALVTVYFGIDAGPMVGVVTDAARELLVGLK